MSNFCLIIDISLKYNALLKNIFQNISFYLYYFRFCSV